MTYRHTRFACYIGYIIQAVINNFLPILFVIFQTDYAIGYEALGNLILINFLTQLAVDIASILFVDRIGYRKSVQLANVFSALGLICLGVLPQLLSSAYAGLVISILLYATGSGLIEVLVSPIVEALPSDNKTGNMSLLHSFYCWGQVLTIALSTVALRLIGQGNWWILPMLWAVLPICNFFFFASVPLVDPPPEEERMPLKRMFRSRVFWAAMVLMACAGAAELSMSQWASMFAEQALGVPKMVGDLLGPCAFAVFMGTGRVLYAFFNNRIPMTVALALCAGLCALCYFTAAVSKSAVLSLIGCALCGFSVSILWPGIFSLSARVFPGGGTAMFSILAMCGDLGCAGGPWLTGLIAERWGLNMGFLASVAFPLILLIALIGIPRQNKA